MHPSAALHATRKLYAVRDAQIDQQLVNGSFARFGGARKRKITSCFRAWEQAARSDQLSGCSSIDHSARARTRLPHHDHDSLLLGRCTRGGATTLVTFHTLAPHLRLSNFRVPSDGEFYLREFHSPPSYILPIRPFGWEICEKATKYVENENNFLIRQTSGSSLFVDNLLLKLTTGGINFFFLIIYDSSSGEGHKSAAAHNSTR